MFKSFRDNLKEIERLYDAKDYNATILESAKLTEQAIQIFFSNFHTFLDTKEDWRKYLDFEQEQGEKYLNFLKKPTIGVSIGYYNSLYEIFPSKRGISPEIRQYLSNINTIRNANLHSNQKDATSDEAGRMLDQLEVLLNTVGLIDISTTVIGVPIKYYLVFTSVKEKFETSESTSDFKKVVDDSLKIIPPLLNVLLNRIYHTLDSENKRNLIDLFISSVDKKKEDELRYYIDLCKGIQIEKLMPAGQSFVESLNAIANRSDDLSRRQSRHYVNIVDIIINYSSNPETTHFLTFADAVKKRFLQNQRINETDQIILSEKAKELKISKDLANKIEASVISTIERDLIPFKTLALSSDHFKSSSILPDFDYDIFISYSTTQPGLEDWVTEFAERLRRELSGILKDKLTICFSDQANSNFSVEQASKKSIIFIPIITPTYFDTDRSVWESEFVEFKKTASNSELGVTLGHGTGNVISRIVPVIATDIEPAHKSLLESELKGSLRTIDFVYREQGLNRALAFQDDEIIQSQGQLLYRNQINRVAICVKEIVIAANEKPKVREAAEAATPVDMPEVNSNNPKIFLAWTSSDLKGKRDEIAIMLERASFTVLPMIDCPSEDEEFKEVVKNYIAKADYSLHMISGEYGRRFEREDDLSYPKFQYLEARRKSHESSDSFKLFIWYVQPPGSEMKPLQQSFINEIRMNITAKMMFSNVAGGFQLVENILSVVQTKKVKKIDAKEIEIFFIYCEDDEFEAADLTNLIGKEYPLEILNVLSSGDEDYKELSRQQVLKSKLAVVYFKHSADWAIPFVKQLWREVGGAGSPTPMMLVGEDEPKTNRARKFKAPKIICEIIPKEIIPQEILNSYSNLSST